MNIACVWSIGGKTVTGKERELGSVWDVLCRVGLVIVARN